MDKIKEAKKLQNLFWQDKERNKNATSLGKNTNVNSKTQITPISIFDEEYTQGESKIPKN